MCEFRDLIMTRGFTVVNSGLMIQQLMSLNLSWEVFLQRWGLNAFVKLIRKIGCQFMRVKFVDHDICTKPFVYLRRHVWFLTWLEYLLFSKFTAITVFWVWLNGLESPFRKSMRPRSGYTFSMTWLKSFSNHINFCLWCLIFNSFMVGRKRESKSFYFFKLSNPSTS